MFVQYTAEFLERLGIFAILGSIALSTIIAVIGILPSFFVTGANILTFGPYWGFFISWSGEVIGAWVSFHLYRMGLKDMAGSIGKKHSLLDIIISSGGIKAGLLIFQGRLIPFIPSGFVTLAGAISNVSYPIFIIASALGKLPSIALESLINNDIINFNGNWLRLSITLVSIIIITILLKRNDKAH
ncbi:MAG: VTT domain-containing protein [Clostridia bacterium]|nr:VTT domain-containing protein [Clostridia bacterium]